jgi:hypothetical protein
LEGTDEVLDGDEIDGKLVDAGGEHEREVLDAVDEDGRVLSQPTGGDEFILAEESDKMHPLLVDTFDHSQVLKGVRVPDVDGWVLGVLSAGH